MSIQGALNPSRQSRIHFFDTAGRYKPNGIAAVVHGDSLLSARGLSPDMYIATHHEATRLAPLDTRIRFAFEDTTSLEITVQPEPIKAISKASRKKSSTRTIDRKPFSGAHKAGCSRSHGLYQ
jgi:hypothetical protein